MLVAVLRWAAISAVSSAREDKGIRTLILERRVPISFSLCSTSSISSIYAISSQPLDGLIALLHDERGSFDDLFQDRFTLFTIRFQRILGCCETPWTGALAVAHRNQSFKLFFRQWVPSFEMVTLLFTLEPFSSAVTSKMPSFYKH